MQYAPRSSASRSHTQKWGWILVLAGLCCSPVSAQTGNPSIAAQGNNRIATFLRKTLAQRNKEIAEAAAAMPADKFSFKAPPDDITFGYLILHIADGNYLFCSPIGNVSAPKLSALKESDPKGTLIDRMNASFEFCRTAVASLDDSHMGDLLAIGETNVSRSMAILTLTGTWATHYELQQKYLQLNGYPSPAAQ
jgi:hypothetical protein